MIIENRDLANNNIARDGYNEEGKQELTVNKQQQEAVKNLDVNNMSKQDKVNVATMISSLNSAVSDEIVSNTNKVNWVNLESGEEFQQLVNSNEDNLIATNKEEYHNELGELTMIIRTSIHLIDGKLEETRYRANISFGSATQYSFVTKELVNKKGEFKVYGKSADLLSDTFNLIEHLPQAINESLVIVKLNSFNSQDSGEAIAVVQYSATNTDIKPDVVEF